MIQLIPKASYLKMAWKNKRGFTSQIYLSPPDSTLEKLDFNIRLSSAPILENTMFSKFPNFNRILIPIKGKGFYLNGALFELHEVAYFKGDEETQCDLLDGEVVDLGLIYNPQSCSADAKILSFKNSFSLNTETRSIYLVYVLRGSLKIQETFGAEDDTFLITETEKVTFDSSKNTTLAIFSINPFA